jgi:outer membrane protein OmpA-like peptidoglycan-associated protein
VDTWTDLASFGVTRDLGDRFDIGGKYRILRSPSVSAVEQGGQVEAGYRVDKNVWLTAGWSFDSFDNDLTGENIEREGLFLKLRVKWPVKPGFGSGDEVKVCGGTGERITVVAANPPLEVLPAVEIIATVENPPVAILPSPEIVAVAVNPELTILPAPEIVVVAVNPPVAILPSPEIVVTGVNPPVAIKPAPAPVKIVTEDPYVSVPTSAIELKVNFDTGKADIKEEYRQEIAAVAELLVASPEVTVLIEGHTDSVGNEKYNQKLSEKRAMAVATRLIQWYGIAPGRISVIGYGESRPLESNDTDKGRAKNRRIYAVIPIGYRP